MKNDVIHLVYVIGTRPEAIRSARLLTLLAAQSGVRLSLVTTGQHYDWNMMEGFLSELNVPPVTRHLNVGRGDPADQMGRIMSALGDFLTQDRADALCVFGDTNSSLATAIAAARAEVPVVHIEAGCRSFDMRMPEEINRRLIDHMSALLLAVSELSKENLARERVLGRIEVVGDPQFDVFSRLRPPTLPKPQSPRGLITLHRPQNVDDPSSLVVILGKLSEASRQVTGGWTFPVHPRTRKSLAGQTFEGIELVDPLLYHDLLSVLDESSVCVTDSGGLQKEALWMGVPCVTIRDSTEWLETVWQGANVLAPAWMDIAGSVANALAPAERDFSNPYGDGRSSERIRDLIIDIVPDGIAFPMPKVQIDQVEVPARS